ncbi:MAG: hypothetical protein HRT67_08770 [Flavobacteriaceae bacterium]|nr:hypothetical protein [Flavobacteriaceae bacterium]
MGITDYFPLECAIFSGGSGQYQVNDNGITFIFDSSVSNTNALISENTITVTINGGVAVNNSGTIQLQNVSFTLTYEK